MTHLVSKLLILTSILLISSCSSSLKQTQSGFINDYSKLKKSEQFEDTYTYRSEKLNRQLIKSIDSVVVTPFEIWLKEKDAAFLSSSQMKEIHLYFQKHLSEKLSEYFEIVNSAGENTLTIRGAFTGIEFSEESLSVSDFIPVRIVLNAGNAAYLAATGQRDTISEVSIEAEFIYGEKSEVVFAMSAAKKVEATVSDGDKGNVEAVKKVLNIWIENFVSKLAQVKSATN